MKFSSYFLAIFFIVSSCTTNSVSENENGENYSEGSYDSIPAEQMPPPVMDKSMYSVNDSLQKAEHAKTFANDAFRNVKVKEKGSNVFNISGEARVFEATFNYVVEDGMNELKEGHITTSQGAPAWGSFSFDVDQKKTNDNSTLHIVLYEQSMKDGSRQHQLPIYLY